MVFWLEIAISERQILSSKGPPPINPEPCLGECFLTDIHTGNLEAVLFDARIHERHGN